MANIMRWLHISDFHVGMDQYGQRRLFSYLLDHVKTRIAGGIFPDAVFITGDVANRGLAEEYAEFSDSFLWPLIDLLPSDAASRIFMVPGNHDVDRTRVRAINTYEALKRAPEFLDPTERGAHERRVIQPRFQAFIDGDFTYNGEHWLVSPSGVMTADLQLRDRQVSIVGLNTAWLSASDDDRHRLTPGKALLEHGLIHTKSRDLKIVIGHHPLEWFSDADIGPVKALLGREGALYLCGHLHRPAATYQEVSLGSFLTLQAGASFEAREKDIWVNRLLWGAVDFDTRTLEVEPLSWSRDHQEWPLDGAAFAERYRDGDRWVFPLPAPLSTVAPVRSAKRAVSVPLTFPVGWLAVDQSYLAMQQGCLTEGRALSYFEGRAPDWSDVVGEGIRRREVVARIVGHFSIEPGASGPRLVLVTGASGEGKTTATLQAASQLVSSGGWQVLWHADTDSPVPIDLIARLDPRTKWLILSDDAELVAPRVHEVIRELAGSNRADVHFLLCSRDTDWAAGGGASFAWASYCTFIPEKLRGLSKTDAEAIIRTWEAFGRAALAELAGVSTEAATEALMAAARSEVEAGHNGSLFGALLQVRHGRQLREHIKTLLGKLAQYKVATFDLQHAFALIAILHANDLLILTKDILAEALNIAPTNLRKLVLSPLGDEAPIATSGRHVFTRHRAIAAVALEVLSEDFAIDTDELTEQLQRAALSVGLSGTFVPSFNQWRFLGAHFLEKGDATLGIRLALLALQSEPTNPFLVDKLSQMYRLADQADAAVHLYRHATAERPPRSYYFEWGLAEAGIGNVALASWLMAYSLSDECAAPPANLQQAKIALDGLVNHFSKLHAQFGFGMFSAGAGAARDIRDHIGQRIVGLKKGQPRRRWSGGRELAASIKLLEQASRATVEQLEADISRNLATPERLSFKHLAILVN